MKIHGFMNKDLSVEKPASSIDHLHKDPLCMGATTVEPPQRLVSALKKPVLVLPAAASPLLKDSNLMFTRIVKCA